MTTQQERPTGLPDYVDPDVVLDADHVVEFCYAGKPRELCGGHLWHRRADSPTGWCGGAFFWRDGPGHIPAGPRWQLVSLTPLAVTPSLRCHCQHHGWIRNGVWEPA